VCSSASSQPVCVGRLVKRCALHLALPTSPVLEARRTTLPPPGGCLDRDVMWSAWHLRFGRAGSGEAQLSWTRQPSHSHEAGQIAAPDGGNVRLPAPSMNDRAAAAFNARSAPRSAARGLSRNRP
jgi:hypothetical protein